MKRYMNICIAIDYSHIRYYSELHTILRDAMGTNARRAGYNRRQMAESRLEIPIHDHRLNRLNAKKRPSQNGLF